MGGSAPGQGGGSGSSSGSGSGSGSFSSPPYLCKVTGAGARLRILPVLQERREWEEAREECGSLHFVYETAVTSSAGSHSRAAVLNRLSGVGALDDKAILALLLRDHPSCRSLESLLFRGVSGVQNWLQEGGWDGWWCVKAAKGNGGQDVWVVHEGNVSTVSNALRGRDEDVFIVERYIARPLLVDGRKFHFRLFGLITATLEAWLHEGGCLLLAPDLYTMESGSDSVHLTNFALSKNWSANATDSSEVEDLWPQRSFSKLRNLYPDVWEGASTLWRGAVDGASRFMLRQEKLSGRFELFGLDIMADQDGGVWLLEVNRRPGLASVPGKGFEADEQLYGGIVRDLMGLVVDPVISGAAAQSGGFVRIKAANPMVKEGPSWQNAFELAAYKRKRLPP